MTAFTTRLVSSEADSTGPAVILCVGGAAGVGRLSKSLKPLPHPVKRPLLSLVKSPTKRPGAFARGVTVFTKTVLEIVVAHIFCKFL